MKFFTFIVSNILFISSAMANDAPASAEYIEKAISNPECGYFIRVAVDKGHYTYKYGFGGGQEIKAPYSQKDIDNIIWQCEIFKDQKLNGKVKRNEKFLQDTK